MSNRVRIDPSERALILGRTGAGKTEWVKSMLGAVNKRYPVVIIDPKAFWLGKNPKFAEKKEQGTIEKPRLMQEFDRKIADKGGVQIFQIDADNNLDQLNGLCSDLMDYARNHREIFLSFDECDGIATATKAPIGVRKVWKLGRALGLGAWICNQRSLGIPEIFKSQAESFVVFDLPGQRDREDIAYYTHSQDIADLEELPAYHYWYFHRKRMRHAELMPPIELKKPIPMERTRK